MTEQLTMAQKAENKAAVHAAYVEQFLREQSRTSCSMTDAAQAIWGTSGRGNPNAVRLIEAVATLGFLRITKITKTRRAVSRTDKVIPAECFAYAGIEPPLDWKAA